MSDVRLEWKMTIDHLPGFSVDPPGVLVLTRHSEEGDVWLTVKKADPEVTFSDELLTEFIKGGDNNGMYPGVRMEQGDHPLDGHPSPASRTRFCFTGDLLYIDARDRRLIYRIGEYEAQHNRWRARWPD